ncbi:hypothetical protein GCM10011344_30760 [Dokdonia pacifica]|uniref:Uncharacterized protein n=1 Tax=Dokdonia pacifica TaxID=1627892 RepID=A0A239BUF2_9FLAO|nr:hypothetical protein [Dokdonia pacifica]GGG27797.1 hypothetical protein GCM10011344_30760 [Dokdonia pacifica]SNS10793.1 hypothetical protein SAMN06265376_106395 [Dokdonia pacifica]
MKVSFLLLFLLAGICFSCQAQQTITNTDGSVTLLKNKEEQNAVYITKDGRVGIGKKNPTDKLEVNGQIHAKSAKLDLKEWADYVFEDGYDLVRLREIEKYINTHGHLPEVPTTEEVQENGIELGQMNVLLLKKIEELTLYLIEKEHQVQKLQKQYDELQQQIKHIQESIKS